MQSLKKLTVCLMATLLAGCATSGVATSGYCVMVTPILISKQDALTDETARQILSHNETYDKVCKPR